MRTLTAFGILWSWQRLSWAQHAGLALLLALKTAVIWGWPFMLAGAIEALGRGPRQGLPLLLLVFGLVVGALLLNPLLHRWYVWRTAQSTRSLEERLRSAVLDRVHRASAEDLDALDSGVLHTRVIRDIDQVSHLAAQWWHQLLPVVVSIVVVAITTAIAAPSLLVAYAVVLPLALAMACWALTRLESQHGRFRTLLERVGALVADSLRTLPVTRAHGVESARLAVVGSGLVRLHRRGLALDRAGAWVEALVWTAFEMLKLGQLGLLAWWCWDGRISLAEVVMLHGLFAGLVASVGGLVWALPALQGGCASVLAVQDLLLRPVARRGGRLPVAITGRISLQQVAYRYPGRAEPALSGIDLEIAPGDRLAIAGRSGSGKSTLLAILLGLRQPQQGRALCDGIDVRELDLAHWRRSVAVVAQRVVLAHGSLRDNLLFGTHGIGDAQLHRVLDEVALGGFCAGLPRGLDTLLGEDGVTLSGGQRQRLSIARALVRDPLLVVLDEADAALDPATGAQVQAALDRLCAGRTVITVSHRPAALAAAGRVIVLEHGRIRSAGAAHPLSTDASTESA